VLYGGAYWQGTFYEGSWDPGTAASDLSGGYVLPYYFTIDMGRKSYYSRFMMWMRNRSDNFSATIPSKFTVWGCNDPESPDDIAGGDKIENFKYWTCWKSVGTLIINGTDEWMKKWVKIADCQLVLPSGLIYYGSGTLTAEDRQSFRDGFNFDVLTEASGQAFRYLRFRVEESNTPGLSQAMICEFRFFGSFDQ
jgi:hypothetical protein